MSERNPPVDMGHPVTPEITPRSRKESKAGRAWVNFGSRLFTLSEGNLFLLLSIMIGLFSGLAVVVFRMAIQCVRLGLLGSALAPAHWRVLLVPSVAGLIVAFLVEKFFPRRAAAG